MFHDPEFLPFDPNRRPTYRASLRNFLEAFPPQAYRDGFTSLPGFMTAPRIFYLTDPDLIEELLVTRAEHFTRDIVTANAIKGPIDRESLFFAEGAEWKWQRRAVSPAFRHENILALVPTFAKCADRQAQAWRAAPAGAPIDAMRAMLRTTFSVIEAAVLGASDSLDGEKFLDALTPALGTMGWRYIYALFGLPMWLPHPGAARARAAIRYLGEETAKAVAARRATEVERRDILGLLLSARDPETNRVMTEAELAGNLYSVIVAGHETAAVALTFTLWLLAKDQASQQRVREEVRAVAGDAAVGPDTVEKLVFTRQALLEGMRLFPPAPSIGRQPRRDTMLGPHKVLAKEPIYVALWCLHRNEKLWDTPNAFDPDRFAPEKAKARHRYAYLPFGAGPRICVGMNFALLEMTTIVATLIREFHLSPAPGHRLELATTFTVRPKGGLPLVFEPVEASALRTAAE
ncbi:MAG TPA: cytochrome P450 [Methylocystis sp.]|nr:cytochrome P450 [Methylocystis sp.]